MFTRFSGGIQRSGSILVEQVRYMSSKKHYDPKFKKQRREKVAKIELPDFQKLKRDSNISPEELRSKLKREGLAPPRPWQERPIHISATGDIFEPYVPPEGDGKLSLISMTGAKQRFEWLEKKGKSMMAVRKIRSFEEDFNLKIFASEAQDKYIEAHKALVDNNEDKLHDLVTERCFPEMTYGLKLKTLRWNFIESIEPPIAVHVRQTDLITEDNIYAQITVRMHTKQTMAIYDSICQISMVSGECTERLFQFGLLVRTTLTEHLLRVPFSREFLGMKGCSAMLLNKTKPFSLKVKHQHGQFNPFVLVKS
ncbi:39S ribosomal protein L45, mitochondrial [Chamberlinius hualienensis]